jgi:hypothetical protein
MREGAHHSRMTNDTHRRQRRFSEGMEQMPELAASARPGSFADGMALAVDARVGSFADGQALRPDAPGARRIGTFADSYVRPVDVAPTRPRLGVARGRPRPQQA